MLRWIILGPLFTHRQGCFVALSRRCLRQCQSLSQLLNLSFLYNIFTVGAVSCFELGRSTIQSVQLIQLDLYILDDGFKTGTFDVFNELLDEKHFIV